MAIGRIARAIDSGFGNTKFATSSRHGGIACAPFRAIACVSAHDRTGDALGGDIVGASELAQLGYCERVVMFDWHDGPKRTRQQLDAQSRGNAAHERFHRDSLEVVRASQTRGKCFVATLVLGECDETRALRAFRDLYLRRSIAGRWCVGAYYRLSPALCRALKPRARALAMLRPPLTALGRAAAKAVEWRISK